MRGIIILILVACITSGCDTRQREEALQKRTAELDAKEKQLVLKEQSLQTREEQLLQKELRLDSSRLDSLQLNPALQGNWSVKMTCTEATCTGSAVGDTKIETWTFSRENNLVIARAMAGDKLVRTYAGTYINGTIELVDNIEPNASAPATKMIVRLNSVSDNTMDGIREIIRPDCKIVYTLKLSK